MRIYAQSSEEALHARKLLTEWAGEDLITKAQYERLEKETVCDLRTTNIFLRLVLFFFTLIGAVAGVALFFRIFLWEARVPTLGFFLLIAAVVCYAGAEFAASQEHLYRHGIEEALAAWSVGFLCAGIYGAFFADRRYSPEPRAAECIVPAVGAALSLWIWRRFGLWYAFPAAMIFAIFLPGYWTSSVTAMHVFVAAIYGIGLVAVIAARSGKRFGFVEEDYSAAEAFLWLGIYLTINLKISSLTLTADWWSDVARAASEFPRPFYWTTWVLIWCLPAVVLARGIRLKDRFVIAVGAIAAILTFVTNKPYLAWARHTWDPMILGVVLTGIALYIQRWLARGEGGVRHGFTAARRSAKDKQWMNAGSAMLGVLAPPAVTPSPQASEGEFRFGGGSTGGGGAGGEF